MSKKVKKKAPKSSLTADDRAALVKAINESRALASCVLECGSAMANDCHEVEHLTGEIARKLGLKQENWYSNFE